MAMDPALAGLLGALVGGGATFVGTVVSNTQQARHTRDRQRLERKVEAYSNSVRSLLRAAHRRSEVTTKSGASVSIMGQDQVAAWFDDLIDAEYWTTVLTTACGSRQRQAIQEAAKSLHDAIDEFTTSGRRLPLDALQSVYRTVAEAARADIGVAE